jgi:hypothetical protein
MFCWVVGNVSQLSPRLLRTLSSFPYATKSSFLSALHFRTDCGFVPRLVLFFFEFFFFGGGGALGVLKQLASRIRTDPDSASKLSGWILILLASCLLTCMTYAIDLCTVKNS